MRKDQEKGETMRQERSKERVDRRESRNGNQGEGKKYKGEKMAHSFLPALCISALSFPKQLGVLLTVFEVQHCPAAADEYNWILYEEVHVGDLPLR